MDDDAGTEPLEPPVLFDAQPGPRAQLAAIVEVLSVLAGSASSQEEVFDTVLNNARRLCGADVAQIHLLIDGALRLGRAVGINQEYVTFSESHPTAVDRESLVGRVTVDRTTQQITDVLADPSYRLRENQRLAGFRTIMGAPMLIGDDVVGVLSVWRTEVEPFDARIALVLGTFANQAALAGSVTSSSPRRSPARSTSSRRSPRSARSSAPPSTSSRSSPPSSATRWSCPRPTVAP